MPIINIVIILFLLAMIYMGTVQGLFSSFLHLAVVIVAGALAFALWEPVTLGLTLKYIPIFAWTLGLLVPFGILLLVLRMISDKLVPANAKFPGVVNIVLGGGCGLLSGILTAGIAVIGIGFLPFSPDLGGYQPYSVGAGGILQPTGSKLWVPVQSLATSFYSTLSRGAFATRTPLALYMPDLDVQSSLIRVRPDFVSIVASPEAVEVTGAYLADVSALTEVVSPAVAEALGPGFSRPGTRLLIVDTDWSVVKGTVDGDRALRLPSSQVRLIARSREAGNKDVELLGPIGFVKPQGDGRVFYSFDAESQMAFSTAPNSSFGWVFLVPADREPMFPQVRNLRLQMPVGDKLVSNPTEVLAALGQPLAPEAESQDADAAEAGQETPDPTTIGDRTGIRAGTQALDLEITNQLPSMISKNTISGLNVADGDQGALITTGSNGSARKAVGSIGARNKIIGFDIPSHEAMVRVRITSDQNQSLFGAGISSAAALNPIFLDDANGNKWFITAWVWRKESGDQEIYFDAFNTIRSAKQLPISRMDKGDEFYLYFSVTKPATLTRYSIGDVSSQDFEPPLKVE